MKIFSGTANRDFSLKVADYLNVNLAKVKINRFADGEEDIKKTDISVGNKEARDAESLNASVLILKKK